MILSDVDLKEAIKNKRLVLTPFSEDTVRENGIDLRLADEIAHHDGASSDFVLDPADESGRGMEFMGAVIRERTWLQS